MADKVYANIGGGGTYKAAKLAPIGQGSEGVDIVLIVCDTHGTAIDLTGFSTITANLENQNGGAVVAIDGTLALTSDGSDGSITWTVSANDTGTDGVFNLVFDITDGTDTYVTLPAEIQITDNPTVSASATNLLVGILEAVKTWLTTQKSAFEGITDGNLVQGDGDNAEDSTIAAADVTTALGNGGTINYVWTNDGDNTASWQAAASGGLSNVVEDTTPQLGGNLDLNGNVITGLEIGTDVQAYDAALDDISSLAVTDGNFIVGNGANWVAESGATVRTSLGLGSLATQSGTFSGGGTFASGGFTLTLSGNGGTLALGGFTLTVPATGTAALLATANVFTAVQQITGTDLGTSTIAFDVSITPTANGNHAQARLINNRSGSTNNATIFTLNAWGQAGSAPRIDFVNRYRSYTGSLQGWDDGMRLTAGQMSGTNISAFDVTLMGGVGTGTGTGGSVVLQVAPAGVSGSSANSLSTVLEAADISGAVGIGFLGASPVARQSHIADSGGDDATAVNAILDVLEAFGLVATS